MLSNLSERVFVSLQLSIEMSKSNFCITVLKFLQHAYDTDEETYEHMNNFTSLAQRIRLLM